MYNLYTAILMAQLSDLAYADDVASAARPLGVGELKVVEEFPVRAVVGVVQGHAFLAFRGTVFAGFSDPVRKWQEMIVTMLVNVAGAVAEDAEAEKVLADRYGCRGHLGFSEMLDELWDTLEPAIHSTMKGRKLWCTGHSLGGALATLAAHRLECAGTPVAGVYTFGSPRVADHSFHAAYRTPHYRFEHRNDVVPLLPPGPELRGLIQSALTDLETEVVLPEVDYRHVGELRFIDWKGMLLDDDEDAFLPLEVKRTLRAAGAGLTDLSSFVGDHRLDRYLEALQRLSAVDSRVRMRPLRVASAAELDEVLERFPDPLQRTLALQELTRRGFGTANTYGLLIRGIVADIAALEGDDRLLALSWKQECLAALGHLAGVQQRGVPSDRLVPLQLLRTVFEDPREPAEVRAAALAGVGNLGRAYDPLVAPLLQRATTDAAAEIRELAYRILTAAAAAPPPAPLPPGLEALRLSSVAQLHSVLMGQSSGDVISVFVELSFREFGTPELYATLVRFAQFVPDPAHAVAFAASERIKTNTFWTLGLLNRSQNWDVPLDALPGFLAIRAVLASRVEPPRVKAAAVASLWLLGRGGDPLLRAVLQAAARDAHPAVAQWAAQALAGGPIPDTLATALFTFDAPAVTAPMP